MTTPVDIAHHVREGTLEIAWDDGATTRLTAAQLRGWCPCATCQGHQPGLRFREPPAGVTIAELHEIGAYALGIRFSDGHDSGIYTWSHLRKIAELAG
jgi:DUF971 family protein